MKLRKKLSTKQFIYSHLLILIIALAFLFGLYYIVNIQYKKSTSSFSNGPVTTIPKILILNLNQPEDNSLFFNSQILIAGKTSPLTEVLIYTDSTDLVIKSKIDGSFSTTLDLDEDINNINVTVFDATGDFKSLQRTVFYSKEKL